MRIVRGIASAALGARLVDVDAVALGNFDGVHRGHQAIIARACTYGPAAVYTFRPHPAKVLAPALAPPLIESYDKKLGRLAALGIDTAIEEPFDARVASLPAAEFASRLADATGARAFVVGTSFTFGRGREGNAAWLRAWAAGRLTVDVVPDVTERGLVVSSTKIRELVREGDVAAARRLLGHAFVVSGPVVKGAARGRQLGFPTANVAPANELLPKAGVYVAVARLGDERLRAVVNVGVAPTFGENALTVETHLFDFQRDIYGDELTLEFVARLRGEQRFDGIDALRAQIAADCEAARRHPLDDAP